MRRWHVRRHRRVLTSRVTPLMDSHAFAAVKYLNRRRRHERLHRLVNQGVRHRVEVVVDLHVVVDVDSPASLARASISDIAPTLTSSARDVSR